MANGTTVDNTSGSVSSSDVQVVDSADSGVIDEGTTTTAYHGWMNEALLHISKGQLTDAMPYLNLCLDKVNNNSVEITKNSESTLNELSLLEKRCFIRMKLKQFDKIFEDARRILNIKRDHVLAFKCLVAAFCKLNQFNHALEVFKKWGQEAPASVEMIEARTIVTNLMTAIQTGIEPVRAFSTIEEKLGLKYDWLLRRKLADSTWKYRPCPLSSDEQLVLCLQFRFGHCPLGEKCTEAHSEEELKEWEQRKRLWDAAKSAMDKAEIDIRTKYMNSISSDIDSLRKQTKENDLAESEISVTCHSPLKCEVQSLIKPHVYRFQIETKRHRLTHICLVDDLHRPYFRISSAFVKGLTDDDQTDILQRQIEGFNFNYDQLIEIPNMEKKTLDGQSYTIEISFETKVFGTFRQAVVFDFEEVPLNGDDTESENPPDAPRKLKVLRELTVNVGITEESQLSYHLNSSHADRNKFESDNDEDETFDSERATATKSETNQYPTRIRDSSWNFKNAEILDGCNGEEVNITQLGFSEDLNVVERLEAINNDEESLTKYNYKNKMRHFLAQEERARQEILSQYNILAQLTLTDNYEMTSVGKEGTMQYAPTGTLFARLVLFRDVSEDTPVGRLILRSCNYVLLSRNDCIRIAEEEKQKPEVYLCPILEKTKNVMYFELGPTVCRDLELKNTDSSLFQIQFQLDRTSFIQQNMVIDLIKPMHLEMLFPEFKKDFKIPWNPTKQWNPAVENEIFRLNPKQKEALIAVTYEGHLSQPILIIGPFGTGKSFTLAQCIKPILSQERTRILICTHSNSAADLYIKEYLDPWASVNEDAKPLRIYFEMRSMATVHPVVQNYCKIDKNTGRFALPTKEDILSHRIIVVTLSTSIYLTKCDLDEDTFSHIFLDEAAQAMEIEAVTPLIAAGANTKLVLAGDYMQLSPELFSTNSRHFQVSLLERLHCIYDETNPCKIMLSENYRSHSAIIQFASDAFYKRNLKCGKQQPTHEIFYPLTFFCARGEDVQEVDSNSYYNMAEVYEVCDKVSAIVSSWPESWGDWRDENAIGVLTVYPDQVARLRTKLRAQGLGSVSVERVLNVQGKQFRAIIISTVRTSKPWVHTLPGTVSKEVDLGFLSNPKLLNTALTRAQSLVAVVGDPVSLSSLGKCRVVWKDFIDTCYENKSLYGMSYSQIKQSVLGTELRFTWGLNPLANDFVPTRTAPAWFLDHDLMKMEDITSLLASCKVDDEGQEQEANILHELSEIIANDAEATTELMMEQTGEAEPQYPEEETNNMLSPQEGTMTYVAGATSIPSSATQTFHENKDAKIILKEAIHNVYPTVRPVRFHRPPSAIDAAFSTAWRIGWRPTMPPPLVRFNGTTPEFQFYQGPVQSPTSHPFVPYPYHPPPPPPPYGMYNQPPSAQIPYSGHPSNPSGPYPHPPAQQMPSAYPHPPAQQMPSAYPHPPAQQMPSAYPHPPAQQMPSAYPHPPNVSAAQLVGVPLQQQSQMPPYQREPLPYPGMQGMPGANFQNIPPAHQPPVPPPNFMRNPAGPIADPPVNGNQSGPQSQLPLSAQELEYLKRAVEHYAATGASAARIPVAPEVEHLRQKLSHVQQSRTNVLPGFNNTNTMQVQQNYTCQPPNFPHQSQTHPFGMGMNNGNQQMQNIRQPFNYTNDLQLRMPSTSITQQQQNLPTHRFDSSPLSPLSSASGTYPLSPPRSSGLGSMNQQSVWNTSSCPSNRSYANAVKISSAPAPTINQPPSAPTSAHVQSHLKSQPAVSRISQPQVTTTQSTLATTSRAEFPEIVPLMSVPTSARKNLKETPKRNGNPSTSTSKGNGNNSRGGGGPARGKKGKKKK